LLLLLLPFAVSIELAIAFLRQRQGLAWLLRIIVAGSAAPILLYDSVYLAELAGPGSREWTTAETWAILSALAASLAGVWCSLTLLVRRTNSVSVPFTLAMTIGGAAVTVMLSGYASGGQLGLPLAAALGGVAIALLVAPKAAGGESIVGLGVIGLFALLVVGRFFGNLSTAHAAVLLLSPLLCWLPELPYVARLNQRTRAPLRFGLAAVPVTIVLILAQHQFVANSTINSSGLEEPTVEDYLNLK
jgi:hypothetical protein